MERAPPRSKMAAPTRPATKMPKHKHHMGQPGRKLAHSMQAAAAPRERVPYFDSDQEHTYDEQADEDYGYANDCAAGEPVYEEPEEEEAYDQEARRPPEMETEEVEEEPEIEPAENNAASNAVRPSAHHSFEDEFLAFHHKQGATEVMVVAKVAIPQLAADVNMLESLVDSEGDIVLPFSSDRVKILHPDETIVAKLKGDQATVFITAAAMLEAGNHTHHAITISVKGIDNMKAHIYPLGPGQQLLSHNILHSTVLDGTIYEFVRRVGITSSEQLRAGVTPVTANGTTLYYLLPKPKHNDGRENTIFTTLVRLYSDVYHNQPKYDMASKSVAMTNDEMTAVLEYFDSHMVGKTLPMNPGNLSIHIKLLHFGPETAEGRTANAWISPSKKPQYIYIPIKLMCVIPEDSE